MHCYYQFMARAAGEAAIEVAELKKTTTFNHNGWRPEDGTANSHAELEAHFWEAVEKMDMGQVRNARRIMIVPLS